MGSEVPIIDSHVHLFPASELSTLAWQTPDGPLAKQHSVEEYKAAATVGGKRPLPRGFILIEADRKHDAAETGEGDGDGWAGPLAEVAWMRRVATAAGGSDDAPPPRAGEGHASEDAGLCVALVPWAPVAGGPAVLERYLERAREAAGGEGSEAWAKVKGVRYLLQDKPNGTALGDGFVDGLKLLGRRRLVFDVGVDQHRRGRVQLEELVEMIDRAHDGVPEEEKVVFILNHMCKPDLEIYNVQTSPSFIAWRTAMFTLSKCSHTYVKLSGGLSEMGASLRRRPSEDIFDAISPWLSVLLAAFGPSRIMFGSDWPVCTIGLDADADNETTKGEGKDGDDGVKEDGKGEAEAEAEAEAHGNGENAWEKWTKVVERLCYMMSYGEEERRQIWGGTALKAYNIEL